MCSRETQNMPQAHQLGTGGLLMLACIQLPRPLWAAGRTCRAGDAQ